MQNRENVLKEWLDQVLEHQSYSMHALTGDASFRRYFRITSGTQTFILMDAPPDKESVSPFIHINQILKASDICVPHIHAHDLELGLALLDDFGDILLLNAMTEGSQDKLYLHAIHTLIQLQQTDVQSVPPFDQNHMMKEMQLFPEWFLKGFLGISPSFEEQQCIDEAFFWLTQQLSKQPQVVIHRDYHSRNLMLLNDAYPSLIGVIDFQDAMHGPITYDLVSLLKDCYYKLPESSYHDYAGAFYQRQPLVQSMPFSTFLDELDFCGLQRHLKVLGIFCRLHLRDGKSNYLHDLPLTLEYTMTCLKRHAIFSSLLNFMTQRVLPKFMEKQLS